MDTTAYNMDTTRRRQGGCIIMLGLERSHPSSPFRPPLPPLSTLHPLQADKAELRFMGLDLVKGEVRNNLTAGVVEPAISKVKSFRFATEAAITILRIDDFIKIKAPQGQ